MATAPLRSGFTEINPSPRVLGSPLPYRVGPWPAILGWTSNFYSSIESSRSCSVASLPLPRSTAPGVASWSFCTPPQIGMVERFNGRIPDLLNTHRFRSGQDLEQPLLRYTALYNRQLPQSAFKSKSPIQTMRD